jgi:Sigma-70, region 4
LSVSQKGSRVLIVRFRLRPADVVTRNERSLRVEASQKRCRSKGQLQVDSGGSMMPPRTAASGAWAPSVVAQVAALSEPRKLFREMANGAKTDWVRLRQMLDPFAAEGRAQAKARGAKLGRKPKLTTHQQREALERRERDDETLAEIGRSYNVSSSTISRLA